MKTTILLIAALGLVFAISAIPSSSAQFVDQIFMQYEGIDGEVAVRGHENEIQLNSFQFGIGRGISSPAGGASGREASAPSISEITVTKVMDKSSPKLFGEAVAGQPHKVTIFFVNIVNDKPENYVKFELENVLISGYSVSSGGDRPTESLSLNFSKITFTYIPIDETGKPGTPESVGYDLATAKKV